MRWILLLLLAGLVLPASASAAAPLPAQVRLATCGQGSATFEGDMRAVHGASRLQMRFTLLVRSAESAGWKRVSARKLDMWVSSDPGRLRYVYDKRVDGLVAPAEYRVRVRFRWLDASGATVAQTRRVSRVCRQVDPRPDLRLGTVRYKDGQYLVPVRNAGRSVAAPFDVSLTLPGQQPLVQRSSSLPAGARATFAFAAPPCDPGSSLQVVLDAADEVDEAVETDDDATVACPMQR